VEELPQLFVFALEELEEDRQDHDRGYEVFASEDLQTGHHGEAGLGV
jgi:hypothetical protein